MQSLTDLRARAYPSQENTPSTAYRDSHVNGWESVVEKPHGAGSKRSAAPVPCGAAAGLVPSSTSDTSTPPHRQTRFQVVPAEARLKRLKRSVLTAARLHTQVKNKWRQVMITATYRPGKYWDPKDITGLVKCIRQHLARKLIEMRYVWVMEYQKNGTPHYHMIVWLPLGVTLPFADKRGWWTKGSTNQVWARSAVGYLAKYVSKGCDLVQYVRGARHHGNGGMEGDALLEQRWWKLPSWLREAVQPSDGVRRAANGTGGGYIDPGTGECFRSPYEVFFQGGMIYIQLKAVVL